MPNKYEREIEEILRNLERTDPKGGSRQGAARRMRRNVSVRRSMPMLRLNFSNWCLVIACVAALCAGGWAFANGSSSITGIIAVIGAICIAMVVISPFVARQRYSSNSGRYNNVTRLRSNPLGRLGTRWHLLMLKLRYRRGQDHEHE